MRPARIFRKAALAVLVALGASPDAVRADKGDLFLSIAPVVDASKTDRPAFGGAAALQLGANASTDLTLEADWTGTGKSLSGDGLMETRILLGSLYTPFFGEMRPRFGGSGGVIHVLGPRGVDELYFNLGFHLQGLYDLADAIRLFAEVHPNVTFGDEGEFSTLVKAGIQFRLIN